MACLEPENTMNTLWVTNIKMNQIHIHPSTHYNSPWDSLQNGRPWPLLLQQRFESPLTNAVITHYLPTVVTQYCLCYNTTNTSTQGQRSSCYNNPSLDICAGVQQPCVTCRTACSSDLVILELSCKLSCKQPCCCNLACSSSNHDTCRTACRKGLGHACTTPAAAKQPSS